MERVTPKELPHTSEGGFGKQPLPQDERASAYCGRYRQPSAEASSRRTQPQPQPLRPTTSFLTAATLTYALGAGITAGAGTRLVLQWILLVRVFTNHYKLHAQRAVKLLFFVAASPSRHWAICAPAAGHSHGCHFSGTLSGIEPQSPGPVTG